MGTPTVYEMLPIDTFTSPTGQYTLNTSDVIDTTSASLDHFLQTTGNTTSAARPPMSAMDTLFVCVVTTASCLSIPSCVAIIMMHVLWPDLRSIGRSMLVQLSIADLLTAIGNLMGVMWFLFRDSEILNANMAYCKTHSALTIFSSIVSFFWTTVTAMSLYLVLVKNTHNTAQKYWKPIWVVCWGVATVIAVTALAMNVLGHDPNVTTASWCWIDPDTPHNEVWNFMTGKTWELLAYFLTFVLYTAVRISLLRYKKTSEKVLSQQPRRDRIRDANVKLMFIPLVFIILRLWGTLRFLLGMIDYTIANSPYVVWIVPLQGFGDTAQGFCNFAMDVLFTPHIRRRLCRKSCSPENKSTVISTISSVSGKR